MNILFLTITRFSTINERGIYTDLMRKFVQQGHKVYVVAPSERRYKKNTQVKSESEVTILNVRTLNIQKTNIIEKGLGTLFVENQFLRAIEKYYVNVKFDLILYSTPPITFSKIIQHIKFRDGALSYLLLKDIFPQNAVEMSMMRKDSILYNYFRKKEKLLYEISDHIGCMSPANVDFVLRHNPQIEKEKIEVCPNSIQPIDGITKHYKPEVLLKYGLPANRTIFVYGGNLGIAQGLDFLLNLIESNYSNHKVFFLIVGSGTESPKLERWFQKNNPLNARLIPQQEKTAYDELLQVCDVGLILLDRKFTIPNYPSRLLSYLEFRMPIIAATDMGTDVGKIAMENNYGFWCENGDLFKMNQFIMHFVENPKHIQLMGDNGYKFLINNYTVDISYEIIMKHLKLKDRIELQNGYEN